jgi:phenylacetate-CoA ligase
MHMTDFYDPLETRDPAQRESELLASLPLQVAHAQRASPAFARILAGVDAAGVTTRQALAKLPVIRKHELLELQAQGRLRAADAPRLRQPRHHL